MLSISCGRQLDDPIADVGKFVSKLHAASKRQRLHHGGSEVCPQRFSAGQRHYRVRASANENPTRKPDLAARPSEEL
jgi:hypothetical protein